MMMKSAKNEQVSMEKLLIGNIWNVTKNVIDANFGHFISWVNIVETTNKMNDIVNSCNDQLLKKFAEQLAISVIRYISSEQMGEDHLEESKIFNEVFRLLKLGYWIQYDGDEAAEDWEELINIARAFPKKLQDRVTGLASSMLASLLEYLSSLAEHRFNKAMEKVNQAKAG